MTSIVKLFKNVFPDSATGHRITFRDQIWWQSAVAKLPEGRLNYHTKKLALRGTCPSPHFAQNGPIAPKIPWTLSLLDVSMCTEFGRIGCILPDLFRKDWFFGLKSYYNTGFQPTIIRKKVWFHKNFVKAMLHFPSASPVVVGMPERCTPMNFFISTNERLRPM